MLVQHFDAAVAEARQFYLDSRLEAEDFDFIAYFNRTMAKPFQWKYEGYPQAV